MTLPTHCVFYLMVCNLFGIPLFFIYPAEACTLERASFLVMGFLGTLIPDISNPYSGFGKLIQPVSTLISGHWGHRSITHSWVMLTSIFVFCVIGKWLFETNAVWLLLMGAWLHITLDMFNISGVRFFYPDKMLVVIPADHELRIATGSKREKRLAFAFFIVAILSAPLGIFGFESSMRFIAGSHTAAVEEYKTFIDVNDIYVEVISGVNRVTQEPVKHKVFKVVAAMPKKLTLVEAEDGKRLTIGQTEEAHIETKKMRTKKGVLIKTEVVRFEALDQNGWDKILQELEAPYSYVIGTIKLDAKPDYRPEIDRWEGVEIDSHTNTVVALNYAGREAVMKLKKYTIIEGRVSIRKEMSEDGVLASLNQKTEPTKRVAFLVNTSFEGIRVKEGQEIKEGDVIAVSPEVRQREAQIKTYHMQANNKVVEEARAMALQDKSFEAKKQIDTLNKTINVQEIIVKKSGPEFKEAEASRLARLKTDQANLMAEYNEIQRSLKEEKEYIIKRGSMQKAETLLKVNELKAEIIALSKISPHSGKVTAVRQKSANVYEIEIEKS